MSSLNKIIIAILSLLMILFCACSSQPITVTQQPQTVTVTRTQDMYSSKPPITSTLIPSTKPAIRYFDPESGLYFNTQSELEAFQKKNRGYDSNSTTTKTLNQTTSLPISEIIDLSPLDEDSLRQEMGDVSFETWARYPFSDHGIYMSKLFFLKPTDEINVILYSEDPIGYPRSAIKEADFDNGVSITIHRPNLNDEMGWTSQRSSWLKSYTLERAGEGWQVIIAFQPNDIESSYFSLNMMNNSGKTTNVSYSIRLVK